jgi:hypothetical protein
MIPAIPALIAQVGLPLIARTVGRALGRVDDPTAKAAAEGLESFVAAADGGRVPAERLQAGQRHLERMAEIEARRHTDVLGEVNRTIRAEVASSDPYVRRMRPTFGYVVALSWAAQMGAVAYVIVQDPSAAGRVVGSLAELTTIWGVGLSVLGVYVYQRSAEKRGLPAAGNGLAALVRRFGGR